jgi:hypothetical protein
VQALSFLSEGGGSNLSWLLWVVLAIFLLIVLIGWWVSRDKGEQAEVQPEAPKAEKSADDLTVLEGVGPKVAQILAEAGYATFADLANADATEVDKILDSNRLQMLDSVGWIDQAKLAAAGDMEGLAKLQDELKGGRRAE